MRFSAAVFVIGIVLGFSGCGKSAQEKPEAIKSQKELGAGFDATRPPSAAQLDTIPKTYAGGGHEFAFSSDGTVLQSYMGKPTAKYKYEANGDLIKIFVNENTVLNCTLVKGKGLSIPNVPFVLALKQ